MTEPSKGGRELENDATLGVRGMRVIGARDRAVAHLYTRKSSSLRRSGKGTAYCGATAFVGFTHTPECCGGRRRGRERGVSSRERHHFGGGAPERRRLRPKRGDEPHPREM